MGFLSGIAGAIAPALNTATQAAGSYEGAQANAAIQQRQMMIQALVFARQQHQIDIENALKQQQTQQSAAETASDIHKNKAPVLGEDRYGQAKFDEANATGYGSLASKIAGAQRVGDIQTVNALRVAAVKQGYDLTKIDRESADVLGRQQQQQGFTVNQEIPAKANADFSNFLGELGPRTESGLFSKEAGDVFSNQFSVPSRALQGMGFAPKTPTTSMPTLSVPSSVPSGVPGAAPQSGGAQAGGSSGSKLAPLTTGQIIRQQKDPQYAAYLKTQGY